MKIQIKVKSVMDPNFGKVIMAKADDPLRRMSAYTRVVAMRSLRSKSLTKKGVKPKPSAPGKPPHSIRYESDFKSDRIKKNIIFEKEAYFKYVVGPRLLGASRSKTVPQIHEFGGRWQTTVFRRTTEMRLRRHRKGMGKATPAQAAAYRAKLQNGELTRREEGDWVFEDRLVFYPARPFMEPAGKKTMARMPEFFKNFILKR